jgi:hypothetical protein
MFTTTSAVWEAVASRGLTRNGRRTGTNSPRRRRRRTRSSRKSTSPSGPMPERSCRPSASCFRPTPCRPTTTGPSSSDMNGDTRTTLIGGRLGQTSRLSCPAPDQVGGKLQRGHPVLRSLDLVPKPRLRDYWVVRLRGGRQPRGIATSGRASGRAALLDRPAADRSYLTALGSHNAICGNTSSRIRTITWMTM